jgi:hypothetical protein
MNNNSNSCVTGISHSRKAALVSSARKYMMKFVSGCSLVLMWFLVHLTAQFLRPRYCGVGLFARVVWKGKGSIRYLSGYSWLLPPGVNPIAVNKYIIYHIKERNGKDCHLGRRDHN